MSKRPRDGGPIPAPPAPWVPAHFDVAMYPDIERKSGWSYRDIGLWHYSRFLSRYRRKDGTRRIHDSWSLTHLGSGHLIVGFYSLPSEQVFAQATTVAELGDWSFNGLEGWRNTDPELPERFRAWRADAGPTIVRGGGGQHADLARVIATGRAV